MKQNPLMYAIIGDIVGSRFERDCAKGRNKILEQDLTNLKNDRCKFTDDTVHTVAIAEAIMDNYNCPDFAKFIRKWSAKYPNAGYGGRIRAWFKGEGPNDSFGNGAYMRISPIYWAYTGYWRKAMMAKSIASSHDNPYCYVFIDPIVEHDRIPIFTENQEALIFKNIDIEDYYKNYHFDSSCQGSVPESIFVSHMSETYVDCIKNAIILGGDTDTQAAIAGGIYGWENKEEIPQDLYEWAWDKLTPEIQKVLNDFNAFLESNDLL